MHFKTEVELTRVVADAARPGFGAPFRQVVFTLRQEAVDPIEIAIWVHEAYPESEIVAVARGLLAGRLADMAEAARAGALRPGEINALWKKVAPGT
jgi:hypothetical protein